MRRTRGRYFERFHHKEGRKRHGKLAAHDKNGNLVIGLDGKIKGEEVFSWWKCACGNKDRDKDGRRPWVRVRGKRYCRKCGKKRL